MNRLINKFVPAILIVLSIVSILALVHSGLPITHDGQDHVARIANFYQNLVDGNLIPRWAATLNWGYGHPILEFLYPLPSYFTSAFHLIGFSLVDSAKIVYGLGMIGAAVYFISHATTFWFGVLACLKALVWPAILVYEAFRALGA